MCQGVWHLSCDVPTWTGRAAGRRYRHHSHSGGDTLMATVSALRCANTTLLTWPRIWAVHYCCSAAFREVCVVVMQREDRHEDDRRIVSTCRVRGEE
jgi:hypothetical protein